LQVGFKFENHRTNVAQHFKKEEVVLEKWLKGRKVLAWRICLYLIFSLKGLQIVFGLTGNTLITLLNAIFIT